MPIQVFDLDKTLTEDPETKDFKEVYNEEAINQAIDLWVNTPYRIGQGYTNSLLSMVFSTIDSNMPFELQSVIQQEFTNNFTVIIVTSLVVDTMPNERMVKIKMGWKMRQYNISGVYSRYWNIS
jgi:hypothetical protein